ncbi:MAG: PKD domain-containing protein [Pirellulaceae bacterium]
MGSSRESATFIPVDEGSYWITLDVSDGRDTSRQTHELVVRNAVPTISGLTGGFETANGIPFTLTGIVADAGSNDSLFGTIDLGNGVQLPLSLLDSGEFKVNYIYRESGRYNVTITIRDEDGAEITETITHNVGVDFPGDFNRNGVLDQTTSISDRCDRNESQLVRFDDLGTAPTD